MVESLAFVRIGSERERESEREPYSLNIVH